jgi:hypothetical protein
MTTAAVKLSNEEGHLQPIHGGRYRASLFVVVAVEKAGAVPLCCSAKLFGEAVRRCCSALLFGAAVRRCCRHCRTYHNSNRRNERRKEESGGV